MSKSKIVKDALVEWEAEIKSGRLSKKALAAMIYEQHGHLFIDQEHVRSVIRQYTGASGKKIRKELKPVFEHIGVINFELPESLSEKTENFIIPINIKKMGIISDIHLPYHDELATRTAIEYIKKEGVDAVLLNGDIIDFYGISRFDRNPSKPKMREEFDQLQYFLTSLKAYFPDTKIYYKIGNHEERWQKYFYTKAPELFGIHEFEFAEITKLREHKIELIEGKQIIKFGALNIIHGHEFGESTFSPVNAARGTFIKALASTVHGHNHSTSSHHQNNLNEDAMAVWSIGCLCELSPDYRPMGFLKWNHGFGIVERREGNGFSFHNYRIRNGEVFNG